MLPTQLVENSRDAKPEAQRVLKLNKQCSVYVNMSSVHVLGHRNCIGAIIATHSDVFHPVEGVEDAVLLLQHLHRI